MEINFPKSMRCSKSNSKSEVYSNTRIPQGTRKISSKQVKPAFKEMRKRRVRKPKVGIRKEIVKIWEEINKIEMEKV